MKFAFRPLGALALAAALLPSCTDKRHENTHPVIVDPIDPPYQYCVTDIVYTCTYGPESYSGTYAITYDEPGRVAGITYTTEDLGTPYEERYRYLPDETVLILTYADDDTAYICHLPLNATGTIREFFAEGEPQERYVYSYGPQDMVASMTNAEIDSGMRNIRWTEGDMTEADLFFAMWEEDEEPYLEQARMRCTYTAHYNDYSIDINSLTNNYLLPTGGPIPANIGRPGITSLHLLSELRLEGGPIPALHTLAYEFDADGRLSTLTVTEPRMDMRHTYTFYYR